MAFTDKDKQEVKRKAHYQCCICKEPFIEVHHIVPEGGDDDIDNAAPLCSNCHWKYGSNPDLRKTIRGMRDMWYEICETRYKDNYSQPIYEKLDELGKQVGEIKNDKAKEDEVLSEIKCLITELIEKGQKKIKKAKNIDEISNSISATTLGDRVHANVVCNNCRTSIGLLVGSNNCPNCGTPIN